MKTRFRSAVFGGEADLRALETGYGDKGGQCCK